MNKKHTPAPWYVIPDPAWIGKHPVHDARFVATCDFSHVEYELSGDCHGARPWRFENREDSIICTMPDAENQKANAYLIAAAPALLDALRQCVTEEGAAGLQEGLGRMKRRILAINDIARAAIALATGNELQAPAVSGNLNQPLN